MNKPVIALILIFSIIFAMTGCTLPIGSIGAKEETLEEDGLIIVPRRILYEIDERFLRNEDFQLYWVNKGSVKRVAMENSAVAKEVGVALSGDHNLSSEFYEPVTTTHHQFFRVGRQIVEVEYMGLKGNYSIQVTSPNNGSGIGGDGGIGIIWMDDQSESQPQPGPQPEPEPQP